MNMNVAAVRPITSSFLSAEKDAEIIIRELFVANKPYSDTLKKLLVVNTKDCLDNPKYNEVIKNISIADLMKDGYVTLTPKIRQEEFAELKSYIIISFDDFITNPTNPHYRDCQITFDIICPTDCWDLGNYRLRPMKIAGYIDGIINNARLTGIGIVNFIGGSELVINEQMSGYTLVYKAVHGTDDKIPNEDE